MQLAHDSAVAVRLNSPVYEVAQRTDFKSGKTVDIVTGNAGIKEDIVGEMLFYPGGGGICKGVTAGGKVVIKGATKFSGKLIGKLFSKEMRNLSNSNIKHFSKHLASDFAKQVPHLSDSALAVKLKNTTFFNPKWSKDRVIAAVQKGYSEALSKGKTGVYNYSYKGETIKIVIKSDGTFDTAYGLHKLTAEFFGR